MELLYFWSCSSVSKHQEGDIFKTYPINKLCMSFSDNATYNLTFTFLIKAYRGLYLTSHRGNSHLVTRV